MLSSLFDRVSVPVKIIFCLVGMGILFPVLIFQHQQSTPIESALQLNAVAQDFYLQHKTSPVSSNHTIRDYRIQEVFPSIYMAQQREQNIILLSGNREHYPILGTSNPPTEISARSNEWAKLFYWIYELKEQLLLIKNPTLKQIHNRWKEIITDEEKSLQEYS